MILWINSMCFSQRKIIQNNDTLICFTPNQCKEILKSITKLDYYDSLIRINEIEFSVFNSKINLLNQEIYQLDQKGNNLNKLVEIKNAQINQANENNKFLQKQVKKQKLFKVIFSFGSGIICSAITYFVVN